MSIAVGDYVEWRPGMTPDDWVRGQATSVVNGEVRGMRVIVVSGGPWYAFLPRPFVGSIVDPSCCPYVTRIATTVRTPVGPLRLFADPSLKPDEFALRPRQPHAFERGIPGHCSGPPDETCAICQCDPRNTVHHAAECKRPHAGKACGCAINAPATVETPWMKVDGPPPDPLDTKYDSVCLRELLRQDEKQRNEHGFREMGGALGWHRHTPVQRAAVSAHWSAELRARVKASAEHERSRVLVDCEEL